MTINDVSSMYDFSVTFDKALAMDLAGDMHKLNDADFVTVWKMIGNIQDVNLGIQNSLRVHPFIRERMTQILVNNKF